MLPAPSTHAKPHPAAAAVPSLLPDVVMPGQRRVANELVFEPSPELSQWQLVAAPVRGLGGIERVVTGRPFVFSGKYGTRLYALPAGAPLPDDARLEELAQYPSSPPPVAAVWSVAAVRPLAKVVTTCRFDGVREEGLAAIVLPRTSQPSIQFTLPSDSSIIGLPLLTQALGIFGTVPRLSNLELRGIR